VVRLGDTEPVWGVYRWDGAGLGFRPDGEEGFAVRGGGRQLLYKGRERSHGFTILGDNRFEYDCILNREPDSHTVTLRLDGAEGFDFFRQPDFLEDPLLAGSYAVYKKETLTGEGTGKLCHIYRPEIFDATGRRVWGELSVSGGRLCITIPPDWLSHARYPVVVDPVIGSTTAGSQYDTYFITEEEYADLLDTAADEGWTSAELQAELRSWKNVLTKYGEALFNKYSAAETLQGHYKAFVYAGELEYDPYACAIPLLFGDSDNMPDVHLSDREYALNAYKQNAAAGWKSVNFDIPDQIGANTDFWFGIYAKSVGINFDYGAECFDIYGGVNTVAVKTDTQNGLDAHTHLSGIQQNIASYKESMDDEEYVRDMRLFLNWQYRNAHPLGDSRYDLKLSIYFQNISAAYTRTLTQGVTLTDSGKRAHGIVKKLTQTARISQLTGKAHKAVRETSQNAGVSDRADRGKGVYRFIINLLGVTESNKTVRALARRISAGVTAFFDLGHRREVSRGIADRVNQTDTANRCRGLFAVLQSYLGITDTRGYSAIWRRNVPDTARAVTDNRHSGDYQRGVPDTLGGRGETNNRADYIRVERDTGEVTGGVQRMVRVVIRIITGGAVRDYLIRRFLKSNGEVVLKSRVCREIVIESRVH
jgi:hypothetical protein